MKRFALSGLTALCLLCCAVACEKAPQTPALSAPTETAAAVPITGTVTINDDVTLGASDVLYIIARSSQGGPPAAVKRIDGPRFPLAYSIGPADSMVPGMRFEGPLQIKARLSRSGDAMPHQGDIEGFHPHPVQPGARDIDLHLAQVVQ